jgi:hypothetical protein
MGSVNDGGLGRAGVLCGEQKWGSARISAAAQKHRGAARDAARIVAGEPANGIAGLLQRGEGTVRAAAAGVVALRGNVKLRGGRQAAGKVQQQDGGKVAARPG